MKRILYLSHIRWGWIKQRPQFFAEGLAKKSQVDYYYYQGHSHRPSDDYTSLEIDSNLHLSLHTYHHIPFSIIPFIGRSRLFEWINRLYIRRQLPSFKDYDVIWITSPLFYPIIKSRLGNSTHLVYDCMDDMAAFPGTKDDAKKVHYIIETERDILSAKGTVICSSDYLAQTITKRAGIKRDLLVINNAIEPPKDNGNIQQDGFPKDIVEKLKIVSGFTNVFLYIGTISEWLDFDKLVKLTEEIQDINVVLIGPRSRTVIPNNRRIHSLGPVNRDYIFAFMEKATALIMPFIVNELIESVNPVKLYEYIYSGKPSLAPYYSESEKFKEYVFLYRDYDEFKDYSTGIMEGKYSAQSRESIDDFVNSNTWAERMIKIESTLMIQ